MSASLFDLSGLTALVTGGGLSVHVLLARQNAYYK